MTRLKASNNNINQEVRRSMNVFRIIKEHLNISWSMINEILSASGNTYSNRQSHCQK